ncbi:DUF1294 domain-containing protein [Bacillus sp. FJAT-27445]|uniref:DUF1294 domain-containing protein n=1 Tax=Bacillus sp. FJAT-27445 TaxID=1679166 RepID=UPI00074387DC|nr:DUF1294 domain-containing protein [Bacillus sp. FJAT-27445]
MDVGVTVYLFIVNVLAFAMMGIDKKRAKNGQFRISERTLWLSALAGGAPGAALGMSYFRHKTKHPAFKYGLPLLACLDFGLILYVAFFQGL